VVIAAESTAKVITAKTAAAVAKTTAAAVMAAAAAAVAATAAAAASERGGGNRSAAEGKSGRKNYQGLTQHDKISFQVEGVGCAHREGYRSCRRPSLPPIRSSQHFRERHHIGLDKGAGR
jgi:hypothetical protein